MLIPAIAPWIKREVSKFIEVILYLTLVARFLYPFYMNPFRNLTNDWVRHWENGKHFFDITFWGGMDAKLYQLWLYLVILLTNGEPPGVRFATGLLCASMPYFWYRLLRELFPKNLSLFVAIIISIHPSFLSIYSFFMRETIVLVIVGISLWLSLRAIRKKTLSSYSVAVLSLALASISNLNVIPVVIVALITLILNQTRRIKALVFGSLILALVWIPTSIHTYNRVGIFTPFNGYWFSKIYFKSGMMGYKIVLDGQEIGSWGSSGIYANPLEPFFDYKFQRTPGMYNMVVDTSKGFYDWERMLKEVNATYDYKRWISDFKDNTLNLLLGYSWPDANKYSAYRIERWNYYSRWLWMPLILIIVIFSPWVCASKARVFILACTWFTLIAFIFQHAAIMEGRYRKPLEPLIIISFVIIIHSLIDKNKYPKIYSYFISRR